MPARVVGMHARLAHRDHGRLRQPGHTHHRREVHQHSALEPMKAPEYWRLGYYEVIQLASFSPLPRPVADGRIGPRWPVHGTAQRCSSAAANAAVSVYWRNATAASSRTCHR